MAAAIASRVSLAGACTWRESVSFVNLKCPVGSLAVVNLSARTQLEACQSVSNASLLELHFIELRTGKRRRDLGRFLSRSANGRVDATSVLKHNEELLHVGKDANAEILEDEGVSKDKEAENPSEFEDMEDIEVEKGFRMSRAKMTDDPKKKAEVLKLARQMKEVDEDMQHHDELLALVRASLLELDTIVARRRKDFTGDFFRHLHLLTEASHDDLERREEIATIASKCLIAVEAHDRAMEDNESLDVAQMKFDDILSSPSLEAAAQKIDNFAKSKELDSTLMLLLTKAWAAAKESTTTKDEAKDIMFYLYNIARANMAKSIPKEVQIMRHLLSVEDPRERFAEMTYYFSPGDDLERREVEGLYTKPEKLLKWINIILDAFYTNKKGTLIKEAQSLLNPSVISRLEILRDVLEEQFV